MKPFSHFSVSLMKSFVRLIACGVAVIENSILPLAWGFGIAEVLGVIEELVEDGKQSRIEKTER